MADYFVTRESRSAEQHTVHRSDCSSLPPQSDCLYLGRYLSGRHAYEVARALYDEVGACRICLPEVSPARGSGAFGKGAPSES